MSSKQSANVHVNVNVNSPALSPNSYAYPDPQSRPSQQHRHRPHSPGYNQQQHNHHHQHLHQPLQQPQSQQHRLPQIFPGSGTGTGAAAAAAAGPHHLVTSIVTPTAAASPASSPIPHNILRESMQLHLIPTSTTIQAPTSPATATATARTSLGITSPAPMTAHRVPFLHSSTNFTEQHTLASEGRSSPGYLQHQTNQNAHASGSGSGEGTGHLSASTTSAISSSRRGSADLSHSGEANVQHNHLRHHHHHQHQHQHHHDHDDRDLISPLSSPPKTSSLSLSLASLPYRDYPPSKEDKIVFESPFGALPHSQVTNAHTHTHPHSHPHPHPHPFPQSHSNPHSRSPTPTSRTLYGHRRSPSYIADTGASGSAAGPGLGSLWSWRVISLRCKEKLCGGKQGGMGRWLVIGWVITTLGFLVATAFWKGQLFSDSLSKQLYSLGYQGQLIFGLLIFTTTIPPLPLYSTLMVLSGYTFGVWQGFVVSYIASLSGAIVVFLVSRTLLRDMITKCLQSSPTAMSLLHIIPANPHLLLLIRIAPYPYNLLNVILASSPSLTLRTYTACTALSLGKLVLHTWIGAGIHDLSELHGRHGPPPPSGQHRYGGSHGGDNHNNGGHGSSSPWPPHHGGGGDYDRGHDHGYETWRPSPEDQARQDMKYYSTWFGVILCIGLFVYLTRLAKRAVAKAQAEQAQAELEEEARGGGGIYLREG